MDSTIKAMSTELRRGRDVYLPSKFWENYGSKNLGQLESDGFDHFKQTIALNYFTWVVNRHSEQFHYLRKRLPLTVWPALLLGALQFDRQCKLTRKQQAWNGLFTRMLWLFAERHDTEGLLRTMTEPMVGSPFQIHARGRLISQDLANSVLEYYSMREHWRPSADRVTTVCELGAGYGRNAYVIMNTVKLCKYLIVDIPPALYLSQRYLKSVLGTKKFFEFRAFDRFEQVEDEFRDADVAFLLPHQAEVLPPKCVDLFINISSLHEMKLDQISAYMGMIDRLTNGYFYSKQWLVSENPFDQIRIKPEDYPIPDHWTQLFLRPARVQTSFFEALYQIDGCAQQESAVCA